MWTKSTGKKKLKQDDVVGELCKTLSPVNTHTHKIKQDDVVGELCKTLSPSTHKKKKIKTG